MRQLRVVLGCSLWLLLTGASATYAQNPLHRQGLGGQPMDGTLPFEQVDPLSGNLVVVATDLVLPGNAGFDLRVQRVYNSAIYPGYATGDLTIEEDSWAGIGWRLHFGRVLNPDETGSGETQIEMGDGSRHPLYTTSAFPEGWITRDFWLYDRGTQTLKLPNGVIYTFGHLVHLNDTLGDVRYVTEIRDVFGNRLEFTYFDAPGPPDGVARIRQVLSATDVREVTFTYDSALNSLKTMTYGERTWRYDQVATGRPGFSLLRFVTPPAGPAWAYEYSANAPGEELNKILAPMGGTVAYGYGDVTHRTGSISTRTRAVTSRSLGGRDIDPGTWTYTYDAGPNQDQTLVTSPCSVTRYRFLGHGLSGDFSPLTAGALAERTTESGGTVYERETFSYVASEPISSDFVPGDEGIASSNGVFNALLGQRTITRDAQWTTWTTTYTYRTGQGTYNDFGQPWEIAESDRPYHVRSTTFTYDHAFTPYIRGRLVTRVVEVRTSYERYLGWVGDSWTYDHTTGFLTGQNLLGVATTFEPRTDGNIKWTDDELGRRTTFEYAWGRVREVRTPDVTSTFDVNPDGTIAWSGIVRGIDRLGVGYGYDDAFRLRSITPTGGLTTTIDFDDLHGTEVLTRRGLQTSHAWVDGFGRVGRTQGPDGVKVRQAGDACGRTTFQSAPYSTGDGLRGATTTYDQLGRPAQVTDAAGGVTRYAYEGAAVTITDPEQRSTAYHYDPFGGPAGEWLTSVVDADGNITRYDYDVRGNLVKADVPGVPSRTWQYSSDRLVTDTQPESGTTTREYYANGLLRTVTNAKSEVTEFTYDASNRLSHVEAPGSADDVTITYNAYGQIATQSNGAVATTFGYDAAGRLSSRTDVVDGQTFVSTYDYKSDDSLEKVTYPTRLPGSSRREVTYDYDTAGRLASVKNDGVLFAQSFTYEDNGALKSYQTGGVTHSFTFDEKDRAKRVTALGVGAQGIDLTYTYDGADQVRAIADPRGGASQAFTYDRVGRLNWAGGPWGELRWDYDAAGNRVKETAGAGVTTYQYYPTQQLASISGPVSETYRYDPLGQLIEDGRGTYTYTAGGQLAQVTAPTVAATYRYDAAGGRMARTVNGVTTYAVRSAGGEPLSEFQTACGSLVWTRDTIYAGGRPLGAVRANLAAPTVSMVAPAVTVSESQSSVPVQVRLTTAGGTPTTCPVTVSYTTVAGTAGGSDVAFPAGTVTFPAGTTSGSTQALTIAILPDLSDEPDRTLTVTLSTATGATLTGTSATAITVQDDDPTPTVSISNVTVTEGNVAPVTMTFNVTLSAASGYPITVHYAFADLAATAGADYTAPTYSGTLTIPIGASYQTMVVQVMPDLLDETLERFRITLSNPTNATLGTATALGTIVDNDPPTLTIGNVTVKAGQPAQFTATLTTPAEEVITVHWGTFDETALVGVDYGSQSGVVTFAIGDTSHTVQVGTILDAPERDESFGVSFYQPAGSIGTVLIPSNYAYGTIVNRRKGDLTGDGHPDLVWQHRTEGTLLAWTMNGVTRTGYPYLTPDTPGSGWELAGMGDFTNDGYQDLLFQHTSGALQIWAMHDLARISVLTPSATIADANWKARSVGDFNGDGRPDIVFHHQVDDTIVLWLMTGTTVTQSVGTSRPTVNADVWRIAATADLNGDGKDDLIWQDYVNGFLASWYLNGPTVVEAVSLLPYQMTDVAWQIQAAADYTGDGHPDLLWHHQTSDWLNVWAMNGISKTADVTPKPYAVVAALWRLAGPR